MSSADQFPIALQADQEFQTELRHAGRSLAPLPETARVAASELQFASFPAGSLLLGMAEDGLPVLLDLFDPLPGPLLLAGDRGSGKTTFLRSLARAANFQDPGDISFGVLTPFPEEWTALEALPNCLGVWPAYHPSAVDFISRLVDWAEVLPGTHQALLLLFDGFDLMTVSAFPSQQDLRWLLTFGPEWHIWPVISVIPARLTLLQTWWGYFHTCILGQVKHVRNTLCFDEALPIGLADLQPGGQFALYQSGNWKKFRLPPLE